MQRYHTTTQKAQNGVGDRTKKEKTSLHSGRKQKISLQPLLELKKPKKYVPDKFFHTFWPCFDQSQFSNWLIGNFNANH